MHNETPRISLDWIRVRLGLKSRCESVRERLGEYYTWDMKPAELESIEKHLQSCPDCAREWRETESVLARIESASPIAAKLKSVSSDEFLAGMIARIDRYESERARHALPFWQRMRAMLNALCPTIRIRRFAAVVLIMISISALAYLSPLALNFITGAKLAAPDSGEETAANSHKPQSNVSDASQGARSPVNWPAHADGNVDIKLPLGGSFIKTDLDGRFKEILAEAQVEMMLPHTEAEWEAWARKEYPHIMWVYDVLTKPEYGINWDGKPAYIPDWAKNIWSDEVTRPTGWRALVFYSGEIFKFDYPIEPTDPNVRPTIEPMKLAAAIAGYEFQMDGAGKSELPKLKFADLDVKNQSHEPVLATLVKKMGDLESLEENENVTIMDQGYSFASDYADQIFGDRASLTRTLVYIATTSHCVPESQWAHLEHSCKNLLFIMILQGANNKLCNIDELRPKYKSVMVTHARVLERRKMVNIKMKRGD